MYTQDPVIFTKDFETDDVAQIFVDTLEENIRNIYQKYKFPKKMIFRDSEKKSTRTPSTVTSARNLYPPGECKKLQRS